jgi:hypothetical protein
MSCGDDEDARPQAAFYLSLNTTAGADCSSANTFQLPEDGQVTATSTTGKGERIVDSGGNTVTCSVRAAADAPGSYEVDLTVQTQADEIGYFNVSGVVSETASDLEVHLQTDGFQLEQEEGCTATIDTAIPGAIWLRDLLCPQLRDERTIGNTCTGRGALIFENCSR